VASSQSASVAVQQPALAGSLASVLLRDVNPLRMLFIVVQLGLIILLAQVFHLEHNAMRKLLVMITAGFVVHHVLPMRWRMPFFVFLCFAGLGLVVGVANALRLSVIGIGLIGLCHLPVAFNVRLALIALAAAALVLGRADLWINMPGYEALWPILGSMYMFRLAIYLYDLKHKSAPFSIWRSLAYFFMLPNVCYPMYPVVDYQLFNKHYFDENCWRIYQVGVKWIFRGMLHLILYRLVTRYVLIDASEVENAAHLVQYMVATYGLYLLISGMFHIVVGVLHLFGFNLPETHHLYFLSASFTDFWRRINIYWKDFILKLFFNPVYFKVKSMGAATAMIIATLVSFFFTWLLHSYQWFWIRGQFPLPWQDISFWGILALLVLVNVLYEQKFGRTRRLKGQKWPISARALIGVQTVATYIVISTLWCMWTFQGSVGEWLNFMGYIAVMDGASALKITGGLVALGVVSAIFAHVGREHSTGAKLRQPGAKPVDDFPFWRSVTFTIIPLGLILGFVQMTDGLPMLRRFRVPFEGREEMRLVVADLRQELSEEDRDQQDRGYYEDLTNTKNYNLALWELYNQQPVGLERLDETEVGLRLPDAFHQMELVPSKQIIFRGATMTTNAWGMRDREYTKEKPAGTYRIAFIGTCTTMGWGVEDDQSYENRVEDRLNAERVGSGAGIEKFELLNFGVGGYSACQQMWTFDKSLEFHPDVVMWEVHATVLEWVVNHLSLVIQSQIPIPYPELQASVEALDLPPDASRLAVKSALQKKAPELLVEIWKAVKQRADSVGVEFRLLLIQRADARRQDFSSMAQLRELAAQAGVELMDITQAYEGVQNQSDLRIAVYDSHPNAEGHRYLGEELYEQLMLAPPWQPSRTPSESE